jgi:hypothetical protein
MFLKGPRRKKMAAGGGRSIYTNFEIVFNAPLSGMSLLNTIFFFFWVCNKLSTVSSRR